MDQKRTAQTTKERQRPSVLIASQSGRMRDSLRLLLATAPDIEVIGCADDSTSALAQVVDLCPTLLLLDANLPGEDILSVLKRIRDNGCQTRCLVLADTQRQQQDALAAGADAVLIKGYSATRLFEAVKELTGKRLPLSKRV